MKLNLIEDAMPANKDVVAFKPNYHLAHHTTNNVAQLEDNSKMRLYAGCKSLEHRGTGVAAKHVKHANSYLAALKDGTKSANLRNKRCTNMPGTDSDTLDNRNQGFHIKNRTNGINKPKEEHDPLYFKTS